MNKKEKISGLLFMPSREEMKELRNKTKRFIRNFSNILARKQISARVFLGGSLAKGTLVKKEVHDVDIFVLFKNEEDSLSEKLEKAVALVGEEYKIEKIHGSRDYFQVSKLDYPSVVFELIPVLSIRHPKEAKNVTDLSYFHVKYLRKSMPGELMPEVVLAKAFCKAQGVYGAESYISGFSGYALECLILYYGSFNGFVKAFAKMKTDKPVIIDPARYYPKKELLFIEMNESKRNGPVILVDPTWKERNVLAALSKESFEKIQKACVEYLQKPSLGFFL